MKNLILISISLFILPEFILQNENDEQILETLLHDFLQGASVNDYEMHDRFWAEDLIYTSAAGERIRKEDIMNGLTVGNEGDEENLPVYSAEEIIINVYGDTAIVAFMLIADIQQETGNPEIMKFYNTGTFLKRDGEWRAVAWQATRIL